MVKNYTLKGIAAGLILFGLYMLILTLANSFSHALEQLALYWYFIAPLVTGFGLQVGLYSYTKSSMTVGAIAATGGISTGSMVACCLHHTTDILPIIGLSAASLFLLKYQVPFMVLGIFSNLIGITIMLNIIQKQNISKNRIFKYNMQTARNIAIMVAIVAVPLTFLFYAYSTTEAPATLQEAVQEKTLELAAVTNNENSLTIKVKPLSLEGQAKFEVSFDTHQGILGFDVTKVSKLFDAKGNEYLPLKWEGSGPEGHHRSGTLTFPELKEKTGQVTLIIYNVYNIPERKFSWTL